LGVAGLERRATVAATCSDDTGDPTGFLLTGNPVNNHRAETDSLKKKPKK
jgi:hypothetical protein